MRLLRSAQRIVALMLMTTLVIETAPSKTQGAFSPRLIASGAQALSLPSFTFTREWRNSRQFPRLAQGEWQAYRDIIRKIRQRSNDSHLAAISFAAALAVLFSPAASLLAFALLDIPQAPNPNPSVPRKNFRPPRWVKRDIDKTAERAMAFILDEGQMPQETDVQVEGTLSAEVENIADALHAADSFEARKRYLGDHGFQPVQTDWRGTAFVRVVDGALFAPALPADAPARLVVFLDRKSAAETVFARVHPLDEALYDPQHIYAMNDPQTGKCERCLSGDYAAYHGFEVAVNPASGGVIFRLFRDITVVLDHGQTQRRFDPAYMDQLIPAMAGAVIAAQSIKDPPYWYVWARDAALLMKALAHQLLMSSRMLAKLAAYVSFQKKFVETIATLHAWGDHGRQLDEGKGQVNGDTLHERHWSRQADGPALKATALVDIAERFMALNKQRDSLPEIWTVVTANLAYVIKTLNDPTMDLWEENMQPSHFYTRLAQYRGLKKGVSLWFSYGQFHAASSDKQGALWDGEAEKLRARIARDHVKKIDAVLQELALRTAHENLYRWASAQERPGTLLDFIQIMREDLDLSPLPTESLQDDGLTAIRATLQAIPSRFGWRSEHAMGHEPWGIDRPAIELYSQLLLLMDFKFHLAATLGDWHKAGDSALIVASVYYDSEGQSVTQRALDSAVIGAVIHNMEESEGAQRIFDADDPAVITTFVAQEYISRRLYPINDGRPAGKAVWNTRYPGDIFNGAGFSAGNPWVLTTSWSGRYLFYLNRSLLRQLHTGYPEWIARAQEPAYQNALHMLFGEASASWPLPVFYERVDALMAHAVDYVNLVKSSILANDDMYEEVDGYTLRDEKPIPRGARNLAWSFREWNRLLNDWVRTYALLQKRSPLELLLNGMPVDARHLRAYFLQQGFRMRRNGVAHADTLVGAVGNLAPWVSFHPSAYLIMNGYRWVDLVKGTMRLNAAAAAQDDVQVLSLVSTGNSDSLEDLLIEMFRHPAEVVPALKKKIEAVQRAVDAGDDSERQAVIADLDIISALPPDTAKAYFGKDGILIVAHLILALRRALGVDTLKDNGMAYWFDAASRPSLFEAMREMTHAWPAGKKLRLLQGGNPQVLTFSYGDMETERFFYMEGIRFNNEAESNGPQGKAWTIILPDELRPLLAAAAGHAFDVQDTYRASRRTSPNRYQRAASGWDFLNAGFAMGIPPGFQCLKITDVQPAQIRTRAAAAAAA